MHTPVRAVDLPDGKRTVDRDRVRPALERDERLGITATGLNLTAGQPAYKIAVDPAVVPLQSFEHVTPNPFATSHAFYAGDTGGAIIGRHVDIYDWLGRSAQDAWGVRHVKVTPAPNPGTGNLLGEITPAPTGTGATPNAQSGAAWTPTCDGLAGTATLKLVPGQQARILPDGTAAAPQDAPAAVKVAIAAANEIHTKPYPSPTSTTDRSRSRGRHTTARRPCPTCSTAPGCTRCGPTTRPGSSLGDCADRALDHRVRRLRSHVDRDRRARARHRRLRRPRSPAARGRDGGRARSEPRRRRRYITRHPLGL